jgi:hypothetical protein
MEVSGIEFVIGEWVIRYAVGKTLLGTMVEDELSVALGDEIRKERLKNCLWAATI